MIWRLQMGYCTAPGWEQCCHTAGLPSVMRTAAFLLQRCPHVSVLLFTCICPAPPCPAGTPDRPSLSSNPAPAGGVSQLSLSWGAVYTAAK